MRKLPTGNLICGTILVVLLTACETPSSQSADYLALADRLHASAMQDQPQYTEVTSGKAMIACIDWRSQTGGNPRLVWTPWTYVGDTSDANIFVSTLENDALTRCKDTADDQNWNCTCHTLDRNGQNVLRIPSGSGCCLLCHRLHHLLRKCLGLRRRVYQFSKH